MTQEWQNSKPNCYVEFRVYDDQRFTILERFFKPLKDYTQKNTSEPASDDATVERLSIPSNPSDATQEAMMLTNPTETVANRKQFAKPEEWLLALRPQDIELLGMPQHAVSVVALREWQGLSRRERRKAIKAQDNVEQLRILADFNDMLRYWQDVEYQLIALERIDSDKGRVTYLADDFPFEGKVAIEELLMFFGFLSILKDSC